MKDDLRKEQLKFKVITQSKRMLTRVLILAVFVLILLPFWTSFQDALTRLVMRIELYKSLQDVIVPYELRVIGTLLTLVGLPIRVGNAYIEWTKAGGGNEVIYLAWNCIGWQSFLLLMASIVFGFGRKYTISSQALSLVFGIAGLFLVNVTRLAFTALLAVYAPKVFTIIFHNYLAALATIVWLFFFWWFSYSFVLEARES